ncbi:MAG: NADH-quinone oxidoreductase subunit J [Candidatus Sericytochromatia bacterium]
MWKDKSFLVIFGIFVSAIVLLLTSLVVGSIGFGKDLAFYLLSGLMISSAVGVVTVPNLMHAGFLLVLTFVSTAGIYALLNADFLAAAQILINGGAVTIMMMFAVMLTNAKNDSDKKPYSSEYRFVSFVLCCFGLFLILILRTLGVNINLMAPFSKNVVDANAGNIITWAPSIWAVKEPVSVSTTEIIGNAFFDKYLIPFEIASILLLMALIGAIVLALRESDIKEDLIEKAKVEELEKEVSVKK